MRLPFVIALAGLQVLVFSPAYGQTRSTTADLGGTVRDPSGAVIDGAQVMAINESVNLERRTVSQPDGRFSVPALPPGRYSVRVTRAGFATQVVEDVDLSLGSSFDVDVAMTVATASEQVVVRAVPPALDTQRTAISTVVSQSDLKYLPINGRNFVSLSLITPGVAVDRVPQQGAAAGSGLNFVGQRARANNITVDGVDNNDSTLGSVRATFSQEAIQEFQVVAHSYPAEFGKATGGIVNIITKSGTNSPAGTAFFYLRDTGLNAKEYFETFSPDGRPLDEPKAPFSQRQFGGVIGGPVRRDRTFYFASFERQTTRANNFVTIDDTQAIDLSGTPVGTAADLLRRAGFAIETGHVPYDVRTNTLLGKIDHRFTAERTLAARYNFGNNYNGNIDPFGGIIAKSRGGAIDSTDHMLAAAYTSVHGRAVNELRLQWARRNQGVFPLDPACDGPCDRNDEGGPTVEIAGVASAGRNRIYPQLRNSIRYQALDTITRSSGRHELKAGIDFNWVQHPTATLPLHYGGRYIFLPLPAIPGLLAAPVTAIQAFALGLPAAYVQGYGNPATRYGSGDLSLFVQDSWRLRPNLTLRAGARYQTQFWSKFTFDVPGAGKYGFPTNRNDLAPRLAAAWNPGQGKTTTIHAAYGLFFDNQITSVAGIADIIDGSPEGTRTLVLRFPQTVDAWRAPGRRVPEPSSAYPSLVISVDPNLKTPYAHATSVGADRLLSGGVRVAVDGVFVRGFDQLGTIDYNPIVTTLGAGRRPLDIGGVPGTSASVLQYTSFGETWYRALMVSLEKRFDGREQLQVNYTLSRAQDTSSDFQTSVIPQTSGRGRNPENVRGLPLGFDPLTEKGDALHDERHRLVVSGTCIVPGGVYVSVILTAASGTPFNILAGSDLNGDGDAGAFPSDRALRTPLDLTTSVPRNAGRMPAQMTADLRTSRRLVLGGRRQVEVLAEVYNLFNRANFTEVNNVFGSGSYPNNPLPTYGQFQRSGPPRQVQAGLRFEF